MSSNVEKSPAARGRVFGRVARSIKDMRGEMKRVVWPSRKQVINNTVVVLGFMLLASVVVGIFDAVLSLLITLSLGV